MESTSFNLNKKSGLDLSLTFKLVKIFKEYKPDVVHSHLYAGKYAHVAASICVLKVEFIPYIV